MVKKIFFANVTNCLYAEIGSLGIVKLCVTIDSIYDGKCLALFSLHGLPPSQV